MREGERNQSDWTNGSSLSLPGLQPTHGHHYPCLHAPLLFSLLGPTVYSACNFKCVYYQSVKWKVFFKEMDNMLNGVGLSWSCHKSIMCVFVYAPPVCAPHVCDLTLILGWSPCFFQILVRNVIPSFSLQHILDSVRGNLNRMMTAKS